MANEVDHLCLEKFSVPATTLEAAATCFPRLSSLDLEWCHLVDPAAGLEALHRLTCLTSLKLEDCNGLHVADLAFFLRGVSRPLRLYLSRRTCSAADAQQLQELAALCCHRVGVVLECVQCCKGPH